MEQQKVQVIFTDFKFEKNRIIIQNFFLYSVNDNIFNSPWPDQYNYLKEIQSYVYEMIDFHKQIEEEKKNANIM